MVSVHVQLRMQGEVTAAASGRIGAIAVERFERRPVALRGTGRGHFGPQEAVAPQDRARRAYGIGADSLVTAHGLYIIPATGYIYR